MFTERDFFGWPIRLRIFSLPYSLLLDYSVLSSLPYPTLPEIEKPLPFRAWLRFNQKEISNIHICVPVSLAATLVKLSTRFSSVANERIGEPLSGNLVVNNCLIWHSIGSLADCWHTQAPLYWELRQTGFQMQPVHVFINQIEESLGITHRGTHGLCT